MPQNQSALNKKKELIKMVGDFCKERLNDEYKELCEHLVVKLSRKRNVPFLSGQKEIWAAAIVYAIGQINFLFDKSSKPHATHDDICKYFGTSRSTTANKAALIRNLFKMNYYDPEFSTNRMQENNPFAKMAMINGFVVPITDLFK
jgi:hypothetical protein